MITTETKLNKRNFSSLMNMNNKLHYNDINNTLVDLRPRLKSSDQKYRY